jgi:hypothetical protein
VTANSWLAWLPTSALDCEPPALVELPAQITLCGSLTVEAVGTEFVNYRILSGRIIQWTEVGNIGQLEIVLADTSLVHPDGRSEQVSRLTAGTSVLAVVRALRGCPTDVGTGPTS